MNAKTIGREYGVLLLLSVLGIPIGAAIGAVDVLFGRVLDTEKKAISRFGWFRLSWSVHG